MFPSGPLGLEGPPSIWGNVFTREYWRWFLIYCSLWNCLEWWSCIGTRQWFMTSRDGARSRLSRWHHRRHARRSAHPQVVWKRSLIRCSGVLQRLAVVGDPLLKYRRWSFFNGCVTGNISARDQYQSLEAWIEPAAVVFSNFTSRQFNIHWHRWVSRFPCMRSLIFPIRVHSEMFRLPSWLCFLRPTS